MKPLVPFALVLVTSSALAQQTGVSRPPDAIVEDLPVTAPAAPAAKPSAAIPVQPVQDAAYQPYRPEAVLHQRAVASSEPNPDADIVIDVPRRANELPAGTALRMRLRNEITTDRTQPDTPFLADLTENVLSDGRVVLPAGSTVEGTITQVRGGKRVRGTALIHLLAQTVVLPDGSRMPLRAAVIDTDQYANTRVDEEGNIRRKDHVGATLAAMSLTTGGAAAAGGVLGGPAGALVGAGVGAGVSTAWWLKQDRQAHLPKDTLVVMGLTEPLAIRPLVREPDFSAVIPSAVPPAMVAPQPAYTAPQSFVPIN